jgi:hypothetical protein
MNRYDVYWYYGKTPYHLNKRELTISEAEKLVEEHAEQVGYTEVLREDYVNQTIFRCKKTEPMRLAVALSSRYMIVRSILYFELKGE